jgi:selenocysteine-specific elongation factor
MEPDRWAEERRRGMTIDLGYAWTTLPSGAVAAFVDVPGHERFVTNMLAGVGPVPAVLFVVAADGGWARQSEEHLAALHALDVRHGLLAVTRSDLADPAPATARARERIARSSLGEVDAVTVSGATGAGLPELRAALDRLVAALPAPDPAAPVRLWIDRCFTVRGSGTVVTGTLPAGTIAVDDELELRGRPVTVRAVQSLGRPRDTISGTARVALNLRGVPRDQAHRGDTLLTPGAWYPATTLDVRHDAEDRLPAQLVLHAGSAAVPVRIRPLAPGLARVTLREALPLRAGDRAVLRDPGRRAVVAGVLVLDADPAALDRRGAAARRASELETATGRLDAAAEVARRGAVSRRHLVRLGLSLDELAGVRSVGDWLVDPGRWQQWTERAEQEARDWAERFPVDAGMPLAALADALGLPDHGLLPELVEEAGLSSVDGRVRPRLARTDLGPAEEAVRQLETRLAEAWLDAPTHDELAALRLGRRELAAAERAGRLVRLGPEIVLLPSAPDRAVGILRQLAQPFSTSEARQALGTTRRVAIPLLEHLDALALTERVDALSRRVR